MRILIDIPEELAKKQWYADKEIWKVVRAVWNGTPISDNDTNGNSVIKIFCKGIVRINSRKNVSVEFNKNWWNAPYKAESEE